MRLLSLERLEAMNRHAINLAFPLLTAGVVVAALIAQAVFLPRLARPACTGRRGALAVSPCSYICAMVCTCKAPPGSATIVAFALMLLTLASPTHHFAQGARP